MPLNGLSVKRRIALKDRLMPDEVFDNFQTWQKKEVPKIQEQWYQTMKENERSFIESFPKELRIEMRIRFLKNIIESLIKQLKEVYESIKVFPEITVIREQKASTYLRQLKRYKTELSILEHNDTLATFPEDVIAEAGQRNIADFYEGKMIKSGVIYKTVCIFHKEKTPSLTFFPKAGYYCFGCNKGGDAISFVQQWQGISFQDAIKFLIPYTNMTKPKKSFSNFNPIPKINIQQNIEEKIKKEEEKEDWNPDESLEEFDKDTIPF